MAAMVAVRGSPCLVSSFRIIHLGIKPERGGRPPRERRTMGRREVITGALVQEVARAFRVRTLFMCSVRNAAEVITR